MGRARLRATKVHEHRRTGVEHGMLGFDLLAQEHLRQPMPAVFYCIMVNSPQALQCPGNSHLRVVDLQSASIYYQHLDQLKALMQPMRKMIEIAGICFCCVLLLCNC